MCLKYNFKFPQVFSSIDTYHLYRFLDMFYLPVNEHYTMDHNCFVCSLSLIFGLFLYFILLKWPLRTNSYHYTINKQFIFRPVNWSNQSLIRPLSKQAVKAKTTPRLQQLATPKKNFQLDHPEKCQRYCSSSLSNTKSIPSR